MSDETLYERLRAKYPNPIRTTPGATPPEGTYCVGGALMEEMGELAFRFPGSVPVILESGPSEPGRAPRAALAVDDDKAASLIAQAVRIGNFPDTASLSYCLQGANPSLTAEVAREFARRIARKNDTGNFETAWQTLADALAWSPDPWTPADDEAVSAFLETATA